MNPVLYQAICIAVAGVLFLIVRYGLTFVGHSIARKFRPKRKRRR